MSATTLATIYYTADIFTPDDSDTNGYGEPCEAGHGETIESGWYDEGRVAWGVFLTKDQVWPDVINYDDDRFDDGYTLDQLVKETIKARLGSIDSFDDTTAYAADPKINYTTGVRVLLAAHVKIHETGDTE